MDEDSLITSTVNELKNTKISFCALVSGFKITVISLVWYYFIHHVASFRLTWPYHMIYWPYDKLRYWNQPFFAAYKYNMTHNIWFINFMTRLFIKWGLAGLIYRQALSPFLIFFCLNPFYSPFRHSSFFLNLEICRLDFAILEHDWGHLRK